MDKLVSIVVKVQWWHIVVEVSVVVDVVSMVRARTELVCFESKAWKPKAETKIGPRSEKSEKDREFLVFPGFYSCKIKGYFLYLAG